MNTKIINNVIKMKNSFTQAGRFKNQMYNDLYSAGMREIRERTIDKDRFVLMASKTTGKGKSDITFGVDLKKGYIQKQTELSRILTCYDKKLSLVTKFFTDMQGNLLRRITRKQTSVNGKNFADETITEVPDKYTKINLSR